MFFLLQFFYSLIPPYRLLVLLSNIEHTTNQKKCVINIFINLKIISFHKNHKLQQLSKDKPRNRHTIANNYTCND